MGTTSSTPDVPGAPGMEREEGGSSSAPPNKGPAISGPGEVLTVSGKTGTEEVLDADGDRRPRFLAQRISGASSGVAAGDIERGDPGCSLASLSHPSLGGSRSPVLLVSGIGVAWLVRGLRRL